MLHFKKPQEEMPEEHKSVLIHLERTESEKELEWTIGYCAGNQWFFDVPREVLEQAAMDPGYELRGEGKIITIGLRHVTHWAELPMSPEWDVVRASDIPIIEPPIVQYNRAENIVEIFGGSSPYTKDDPYYLEKDKFSTSAATLKSMAHLAGKTWAHGGFMHRLAATLNEALTVNGGRNSRPA